jgi:SAM-dependent methyltransferase
MLETIHLFNKSAFTYEDWYKEPLGEYALRAELNGLNLLLPDNGIGAEIGAGTGVFAEYLTTKNRQILCIDPAIKMLIRAQEKGLQGILGTAESPPMKLGSLDFIYLVIVLEFIHEPTMALYSLRKLLKYMSPIIILIINKDSPWGSMYSKTGIQGDSIFRSATFYTLQDVIGFLEQAKYKFDIAFGTLLNPPNIIPNEEPNLILLPTEKKSKAGVILVKGIKV